MKGVIGMKQERIITSVSLPASLIEKIDTQADREKRTRSNMIECLLLDAMIRKAQNEEQEKGN